MKRILFSSSKNKAPSISEELPSAAERELHPESLPSRRKFIRTMSYAGPVAVGAAALPLEPLFGGKDATAQASVVPYKCSKRANTSWQYRLSPAQAEKITVDAPPDNGDSARFTDFSG